MQRFPVTSSNLVSVGYDPDTRVLEIEFKGYKVYQYESVPPQVYAELMRAPSKGGYFDRAIRPQYATHQV